ncbi:MAG: hypothetical protein LBH62_07775 [Nitrososphaerota archaeon]|uniref:hypothetical protein n=1 Tax=Candidatus Bathycorpusculum sp. TaxID=2994959 RepID=UPI00281E4334|nr:hypothetical protein [Candidatus Termiticorpusculum sp.]MCL2257666.1 hypothetical protein [Candidatus Termiticorpusculum sp.]MCL2291975.1 hypothetical protein [Candidatus Termiticorpusculum sp.]MDR0461303.1 hypothetical protein [Nitrososphaerota archaeon]
MTYMLDYVSAESEGCSSKIVLDDRIFYVKLLTSPVGSAKYFSANQDGHLQKEISKSEFELWVNILADNDSDVKDILEKITQGKKY